VGLPDASIAIEASSTRRGQEIQLAMDPADRDDRVPPTHTTMPQLLGLPAYARPPRVIAPAPRPLDPDELPLEAYWSDAERVAYRSAKAPRAGEEL
jgi:hypothetical protein